MQKLFVICGPTATGKTALGLELAEKLGGEILSADSRQVYKRMDIVTGKDLPNDRKIWLTDLVGPKEEFSVAQWHRAAWSIIPRLWKENKLPIVVGGTGLYIKALVDGIGTINVPPNKALRARLAGKKAEELFDILAQLDSVRAASLNQSDRKNPRRLVRAIEIAHWKAEDRGQKTETEGGRQKMDVLMVGLTAAREVLDKRIDERVEARLKEGALEEVERLLKNGVSWENQSMTGLGYRQLRDFFEGRVTLDDAKKAWKTAEHKYARRQLAWFARDKRIRWFDITKSGWEQEVEKLTKNWYSKRDAEDN